MSDYLEATTGGTDAATIAELNRLAVNRAHHIDVQAGGVYQTVRQQDEVVEQTTHEQFYPYPHRPRGTTRVHTPASFTDLLGRSPHDDPVIYSDEEQRTVTAVLNAGGWGDHRITYTARQTREFAAWYDNRDRLRPQREFAELLADLRHTVADPPAADVMQIARTFTATRTAQFESGVALDNGDVQFSYVQETRAQAGPRGGTVEIPEEITLHLPVYREGAPLNITLEFRWDASPDGLRLGYRIRSLEDVMQTAWEEVTEHIRVNTQEAGLLHLDAAAPPPVTPMK